MQLLELKKRVHSLYPSYKYMKYSLVLQFLVFRGQNDCEKLKSNQRTTKISFFFFQIKKARVYTLL